MHAVWRAATYCAVGIALAAVPSLRAQSRECGPKSSTEENSFPLLMGYRMGSPLWLSLYAGIRRDTGHNTTCETNGFIATGELGIAGGQASLGFDHGRGTRREHGIWRTQGSLLRTWGRPLTARADRTFAGVEVQYHRGIGGRVSMFWQVDNTAERQRFMAASIILGW